MNSFVAAVFITFMTSCNAQLGNLLGMAMDDATMFDGAPPTIIVAPPAAAPPPTNTANKRMIRAVNWVMPSAANMFMRPANAMFNPANMGMAAARVVRPPANMGMGGINVARPAALGLAAGIGMAREDGGAGVEDAAPAVGAAAAEDAPVGRAGRGGAAAAEDAPAAKAAPKARAGGNTYMEIDG